MTSEMRGFSAAAHAALDEKEKLKGKERRLRHEWEVESSVHSSTMAKLNEEDEWLDASIAHLDGRGTNTNPNPNPSPNPNQDGLRAEVAQHDVVGDVAQDGIEHEHRQHLGEI